MFVKELFFKNSKTIQKCVKRERETEAGEGAAPLDVKGPQLCHPPTPTIHFP